MKRKNKREAKQGLSLVFSSCVHWSLSLALLVQAVSPSRCPGRSAASTRRGSSLDALSGASCSNRPSGCARTASPSRRLSPPPSTHRKRSSGPTITCGELCWKVQHGDFGWYETCPQGPCTCAQVNIWCEFFCLSAQGSPLRA